MICRYLIEEKNYLSRECASSDVPMADRIWKSLSRRIETQVIAVSFCAVNLESCTADRLIYPR